MKLAWHTDNGFQKKTTPLQKCSFDCCLPPQAHASVTTGLSKTMGLVPRLRMSGVMLPLSMRLHILSTETLPLTPPPKKKGHAKFNQLFYFLRVFVIFTHLHLTPRLKNEWSYAFVVWTGTTLRSRVLLLFLYFFVCFFLNISETPRSGFDPMSMVIKPSSGLAQ
jgi:hypothetical protein